jgi:negative regulator of flagellin synthesis FlgM
MKIGPLESKPAAPAVATERKAGGSAAAEASAAASGPSARVALSPAASALSTGVIDPTFDAAKVERLAQAIRDGKFEVNADVIADKLITNAQELLARNSN